MCLPPFSLTQPIMLKHSTIERGFQKPPFCVAKVWFLACKKWVFTLQKYGFCFLRECFLFCNTSYHAPNTPKMALRFSTVGIAMPLFLFIVSHISPRPPRRRRGRFIVPVPTNTPQMALRIRIVGVAIHIISTYQNHLVRIVKRAR